MYLKSLDVLGFKSFANKTSLQFDRGVTAIVGPNGCGKSNVLDAIRWVLGEQSAKALRGGEMADVIFNGTDSRKALGMAEVSLTFAECEKELGVEWNEVCITRRIFRDGKSEYLLNKTPCRLRDIQMLFMDTGIGRTAYSIMEQGKIDQILSSRPDDRRAVFEEAAGITKYKTQKKEALRKLEYTEANLLRVTDIIKEVKRQIGSLQRQAGKARRYKTIIADLKVLETHLAKHQLDGLSAEMDEVIEGIITLQREHAQLAEHAGALEQGLGERRAAMALLDEQLAALRQRIHELDNEASKAESRIGFNGERKEEFERLMTRYKAEIEAAEERLSIQREQLGETDSQIEQIGATLEEEQALLEAGEKRAAELRARRQSLQQTQREISERSSKIEGDLVRSRAELAASQSLRGNLETRKNALAAELDQVRAELVRFEARNSQIRSDLEARKANLASRQSAQTEASEKVAGLRKELAAAEQEIARLGRELGARESRVQVLSQLNDEGEGFNKGTQSVLKGLDDPGLYRPATLGALATLIEVSPEFIPAIEAVLGQNLQAVILRDSEVLQQAICKLSERRAGRASLSAPGLMPTPSHLQIESLPEGAVCWALDKVKAPTEVMGLLGSLLDRVAIVPDLATAIRLRSHDATLTLATLRGEVVTREGIATGGELSNPAQSVLHRKAEIRSLEAELASLRDQSQVASNRRSQLVEELEHAHAAEVAARDAVQQAQLEVSTLEQQLRLMEREQRETSGRVETLLWETTNAAKAIADATDKTDKLSQLISTLEAEASNIAQAREQAARDLDAIVVEEEQATSSLNELRVRVATSRQRQENLQRQRAPIASRLQELSDLVTQRQSDIHNYQTRIEHLSSENEQLGQTASKARETIAVTQQDVTQLSNQRTELAKTLTAVESELGGLRNRLASLQDQRAKLDVRQSRLEMQIESLKEGIQRRYHLDLADFQPDSYALITTIREQLKRANRTRSADAEDNGEPSLEPNLNDSQTAPSSDDNQVEPPAGEASTPSQQEREEPVDWEAVAGMVEILTAKIDAMGPVNIDAIHEFDELEQRHQFLEAQFNDLTKSKEELREVIHKINTTTRQLFAETFENVRTNFQQMFRELFGGGKADLVLVDGDDPLECGIDIIAKPPGKQLQSISLLSGGEKTMTAVALLFSIYMVKPSPFCVLDEMDAPLDESNISRFIKILDRFVGQSQFVVITHNKRTISRADVLYGVTMEEHGVSKLVGVRLTPRGETVDAQGHEHHLLEGESPAEIEDAVPSIAESFGKSGELQPV